MESNARFIIGLICGILLLIKVQIHNYIDKENGYNSKSSSGFRFNFIFVLPYFQSVNASTQKAKRICNIIWGAFVISFIAIFFFKVSGVITT